MKRLFLNSMLLASLLLPAVPAVAQQPLPQELLQDKNFGRFLFPDSKVGWIKFRNDAPYRAKEIFSQQPELLGMKGGDELKLLRTRTDAAGINHYRFAQYYKGVRIELAEYLVHEKKGSVYLINGDFIPGLNLDVNAAVSPQRAIDVALETVPAQKYMWEDPVAEERFRLKKKDPNATLYPRPELLIVQKDPKGGQEASNYALAYRLAIFARVPRIAEYVYVDAKTGEIIRTRSLEISCNSGTVQTTYNGTQSVKTDYRTETCLYDDNESTQYFSVDDCNSNTPIYSWYSDNGIISNEDYLVCDNDNTWDATTGSTKMTMSTLWGVKKAYSYFFSEHAHEGFDGSGGLIDAFSNRLYYDDNDDEYCTNANYTNVIDNLNFGSGADCFPGTDDDYNTDDIIGHEFTHGVIEYAHFDALDYSGESGALNESFADIFGENVENYVEGSNDFLEADDKSDNAIRSFIDPNSYSDPDTYLGTNWVDVNSDADNGGVHTNSSVQNHMFYLLSEGGTGTNDLGIDYNVSGIGFDKASAIAWQAMMEYLDGSDGYIIARNAWIQSAIDLYGSCSQEVISVGQAWMAAGVTSYTGFNLGSVCGTYTSPIPVTIDGAEEVRNATIFFNDYLTTCTATINSPAIVSLSSGNVIQLFPGFTASNGCTFTALINECELSDYDPNNLRAGAESADVHEGVVLNAESALSIYPNPASDDAVIGVDLVTDQPVNLYITDATGKLRMSVIDNERLTDQKFVRNLHTGDLPSGIYVCILKSGGKIFTRKFMVQH
ncbi:MAG: M4 family metallopeptidase [Bacteroidetes bacterium]|nr:M4 family metallopeptidase [Bacteroidota bacterium]